MNFDFADVLLETIELGASDLHLTAGAPPMVRIRGRMRPLDYPPMTPQVTREVVYSFLNNDQRKRLEEDWQIDLSYSVPGKARFRVNAFFQRASIGAVMRTIPQDIPKFESLGLPPIAHGLHQEAARLRPRHRPDRLGQVDDARLDDRHDQRGAARAHHDDRGPDRVPPPAQELHRQPARAGRRRRSPSRWRSRPRCARTRT